VTRGTSGEDWLKKFEQGLGASLLDVTPDFLLACAGFDAHAEDPFHFTQVQDRHFQGVLKLLQENAAHHCLGRLGFTLEGGYSTDVLARLVPGYIRQTAIWKEAHAG
jgi:acetoin utilization deacetylase AcuC-like enzyme